MAVEERGGPSPALRIVHPNEIAVLVAFETEAASLLAVPRVDALLRDVPHERLVSRLPPSWSVDPRNPRVRGAPAGLRALPAFQAAKAAANFAAGLDPAVTVSPPPHQIEVPFASILRIQLPRRMDPWSTKPTIEPDGIVEVVKSKLTDVGALEVLLWAAAPGDASVELHTNGNPERKTGGLSDWQIRVRVTPHVPG